MADPAHPLIEISIQPRFEADRERLGVALQRLIAADPTFGAKWDSSSDRVVIGGLSEPHLDARIETLRRDFGVELEVGAPQVAYRETLGRRADIDFTHKKQAGGFGEFARVLIAFDPIDPAVGYLFENRIVGASIPSKYVPGVEFGLASARGHGWLAGFPVIGVKASLIDGAYHDRDSSVHAFELAALGAFDELRQKGDPTLLEPFMKVDVTTSEDWVGDVIGDLVCRRALLLGADESERSQIVSALVPLANMFGYANTLRAMTQGGASFRLEYDHYEKVLSPRSPDGVFPPALGVRA
jgi:elongation factor G